jgi:transposase
VILASAQGFSPPKISQIALMSEDYIRELIRAFNEHGMAMLKPKWGPGRPSKFTDEQRKALVELATSRPRELDLPYAEWSLSRLREEAIKRGVVPSISEEWLRVILHESDVSHQSIRTWKQSTDPQFEKKKRLIEWLTDQKHNPPIVLSADEIGPIQLIPHGGGGWFPRGLPGRIPAEYSKKYGTTYYFLGLNVFHQELWGRVYRTKHSVNWLGSFRGCALRIPRTNGCTSSKTTPARTGPKRCVSGRVPTAPCWCRALRRRAGSTPWSVTPGTFSDWRCPASNSRRSRRWAGCSMQR